MLIFGVYFVKNALMKNFLVFISLLSTLFFSAQMIGSVEDSVSVNKIPGLIPQKINGKFGYVNHKRQFVISPKFGLAMFYNEDCNLLNSLNKKAQKFGTKDFATVELNDEAYRINKSGKTVYKYVKKDLAKCPAEYKVQKYKAYIMQGFYGIVDKDSINEADFRDFVIYPQYQRLHVMEGDDINNPMIVAVYNNKFGVITKTGKIVIPFIYNDIKLNYSWKLGKMFEVSVDNKEYFYVDENNVAY